MIPKKFAVITTSRTGSNLMVFMLNSHPDILCHFELFHKAEIYHHYDDEMLADLKGKYNPDWLTLEQRDRDSMAFLKKIEESDYGCQRVGFKIFDSHDPTVLNHVIQNEDYAKIILHRENQFFRYTSEIIARETGVYSELQIWAKYKKAKENIKINFDFEEYERMTARVDDYFKRVRNQSRGKTLLCEYTQLKQPWFEKKVIEFLGLEPVEELRKTEILKQNPSDLRKRVENWDELVEYAKHNNLEEWLVETPISENEIL